MFDSTPAWELRERLLGREISPVELVESCLARIDALEPILHAFITVAPERALADARAAEAAIRQGVAGPLCGLPVALKDELWTEGIRSTAGSLLYEDFVPDRDGAVAERLRRAGAVVVGKTNMPEFCTFSRSVNRLVPESVNPWDARRTSGASSGGSAAAVAAAIVPFALGSDGGGSIRIPSSLCGVVGLHPTPGRVPMRGSFSYSLLSSVGPIARDVRDAALLLQTIAGPDPEDTSCLRDEPPDFLLGLDDGVRGMRLALVLDFAHVQARPEVIEAVVRGARLLEAEGAVVDQPAARIPDVWDAWIAVRNGRPVYEDVPVPFTQSREFLAQLEDPAKRELFCDYNLNRVTTQAISRDEWAAGTRVRAAACARLDQLFESYAALITPTMSDVAPLIPDLFESPYPNTYSGTDYTLFVNFTGTTAASYPCGTVDGLPVGLQVIARPGNEATVLRVCRALEQAQPWQTPPPPG